ncbi:type VI secretion system-associated FHA domain protein TagH [Pseudomonas tohonis]|uniref:type VI secretion system-associated FHA domain protein TagH n=2 Tax=Pseudomonas tohonis TaxID=2725477 RepID=UPI001F2726B4|nr:type VI secretion system-associated FHA domain protein TagH [Pseudomonas tohonis]
MPLRLTITSYHKLTPGQRPEVELDRGELRIGRSAENDWVLPDPERLVSSQHCTIQFRDGTYYLTDTSTNGVMLAQSGVRLRRGNSEPLMDGEILKLGEYEILVQVQGMSMQPVSAAPISTGGDPFSSFDALMSRQSGAASIPEPLAPSPASMAHIQGGGSPLDTKPDLFDFLNPPPAAAPSIPDHVPAERHDFRPPTPIPSFEPTPVPPVSAPAAFAEPVGAAPAIPADWDPFADLGLTSPAPQHAPAVPVPMPTAAAPLEPAPVAVELPADFFSNPPIGHDAAATSIPAPAASPQPLAQPAVAPTPPPVAAVAPNPIPAPPALTPTAQATHAAAVSTPAAAPAPAGEDGALLDAFLRGAGLSQLRIDRAEAVAQMESIGRSYRLMVEGLVDVLRARSSLKGEFRMAQTMIRPVENNPLKFAPNVDEALLLLLRHGNAAFMPPDQAVGESFDDLKAHQLAVMAGVQAAIKHILKRFEPSVLEARLSKPSGLSALLPGSRQSQYWELFTDLYASISREAEDDFQDLFGREFSRAYEEHSARLRGH